MGKRFPKQVRVFGVETGNCIGWQAGSDAGAGPNAPAPGLMAVRHRNIERESLDIAEPGCRDVGELIGVNPGHSVEAPFGIVRLDELFRSVDHITGQRYPVEMGENEDAAGNQHTADLGGCPRPIEPVPALTGANDVEGLAWKASVFGVRDNVFRAKARLAVEALRLLQQLRGRVEPGDGTAAPGKSPAQGACSGPEIEHLLPGYADPEGRQPIVEPVGKMRPLGVQILALGYLTGAAWNETAYSNAEFEAALTEALTITDVDKRRVVMEKVEAILQDSGVIIQPYWRALFKHSSPKVKNDGMHPTFEQHFGEVWLDA